MRSVLKRLLDDESGGEALEYALVSGLIIVGCIAVIRVLGLRLAFGWQWINSKL